MLNFISFSFSLYIISKKILVGRGEPTGYSPMDPPLKIVIVITVMISLQYRETNQIVLL